jgi:hypothetical protein
VLHNKRSEKYSLMKAIMKLLNINEIAQFDKSSPLSPKSLIIGDHAHRIERKIRIVRSRLDWILSKTSSSYEIGPGQCDYTRRLRKGRLRLGGEGKGG